MRTDIHDEATYSLFFVAILRTRVKKKAERRECGCGQESWVR